jgi:hypothetical protein
MASLIEKGFIERQNGNAHVQIPFNQSIFKSKAASIPTGNQAASSQQKPEITGNPLLRCWEYTLATSAESQSCSLLNLKLHRLAGLVLDSKSITNFMNQVGFEFDANKTITSTDGHSETGAFALTYTSPHSGKEFEVQTAEQLHEVLNEFAGKKLKVNAKFDSRTSELLANLDGGYVVNILKVQYDIQDLLHQTFAKGFQNLPNTLLNVAGKIAFEAQQRGVPIPSYAPMGNQGHAFNMRLNDPILQKGILTGAWESPEKRQAFLRQQLVEPMLAKTLDPKDEQMLQFFSDLEYYVVASGNDAPSKTALKEVFNRIADKLQGKISYADLAKEAYEALKQEFPEIPDATLQENIMATLAYQCPKMMFADTNWEDDGNPVHWGIQFNPITEQFGLVEEIRYDSGKHDFKPSCSESSFDGYGGYQIIDDPRVLF